MICYADNFIRLPAFPAVLFLRGVLDYDRSLKIHFFYFPASICISKRAPRSGKPFCL